MVLAELTVREAADQLGVTPQRVRQLVASGALAARRVSSGWMIPMSAVAERRARRRVGRPPEPATVWAAVRVLAGGPVEVDRRVRHRVRGILDAMPSPRRDPGAWRAFLAGRARRHTLWAHPGVLAKLVADRRVSLGGVAAVGAEGLVGGQVDLYVRETELHALRDAFALRHDPDGNVVVHVVPGAVPEALGPRPGQLVPPVVAAADLLETGDPRDRVAAMSILAGAWRHATGRRPPRRR